MTLKTAPPPPISAKGVVTDKHSILPLSLARSITLSLALSIRSIWGVVLF
jgi:hypothetical protein